MAKKNHDNKKKKKTPSLFPKLHLNLFENNLRKWVVISRAWDPPAPRDDSDALQQQQTTGSPLRRKLGPSCSPTRSNDRVGSIWGLGRGLAGKMPTLRGSADFSALCFCGIILLILHRLQKADASFPWPGLRNGRRRGRFSATLPPKTQLKTKAKE